MHRPRTLRHTRPAALALCLLLSGCGLKGPLYLKIPPVQFPPVTPAPAVATIQILVPAMSTAPSSASTPIPAAASQTPPAAAP